MFKGISINKNETNKKLYYHEWNRNNQKVTVHSTLKVYMALNQPIRTTGSRGYWQEIGESFGESFHTILVYIIQGEMVSLVSMCLMKWLGLKTTTNLRKTKKIKIEYPYCVL